MYAYISLCGKQYKAEVGQVLTVEKLNVPAGEVVSADVLMTVDGDKTVVGTPVIADISAKAKVLGDVKGKKIIVFKYKAKKNERKKQGHRQPYTQIKIESIG
ncbi:MAG: 50S ribosomal protein L21 [Clostridia bacterium]|nr:50S ribosomal protein L21 [Clostridia bacterium]